MSALSQQQKPGIALRIAAAMQKMNIEGLPRNYELIYEVYLGSDPELVKAFKALGFDRSQYALDDLCRRFLPHHFDHANLDDQAGRVKGEMVAFLDVLQEEKVSLEKYGALVGSAMTNLMDGQPEDGVLTQSMAALNAATMERQQQTDALVRQVAAQTATIDAVRTEMHADENQKFTDALTTLGNRRMFNKELAAIFKTENAIPEFGVAVLELDNMARLTELRININDLIRNTAKALRSGIPGVGVLCRFDGSRFGIVYKDSDQRTTEARLTSLREIFADYARTIRASNPNIVLTISIGVCMFGEASEAFDIVSSAEKALKEAQGTAPDLVVFYKNTTSHGQARGFSIYSART